MLETARLRLRPRDPDEAAVYRQLWTERDSRVPAHRRIDADGRPTVADIAERIRAEIYDPGMGLLAVQRKDSGEVIGYCGLVARDDGALDEPQLAYELLRATHGRGFATEAGSAVVASAAEAGYRRLWADVWDWNIASLRVLDKLGFREHGRAATESENVHSLLLVREL